MQNKKNKRRQKKRAEQKKAGNNVVEKDLELEEEDEDEEEESPVVETKGKKETAPSVEHKAAKEDTTPSVEKKAVAKEELLSFCDDKKAPKEAKPAHPEKKASLEEKQPSSGGEFFFGLIIGGVLLVIGSLIVFLFQVQYLRGLDKRIEATENSLANKETKGDVSATSLGEKINALQARLNEVVKMNPNNDRLDSVSKDVEEVKKLHSDLAKELENVKNILNGLKERMDQSTSEKK